MGSPSIALDPRSGETLGSSSRDVERDREAAGVAVLIVDDDEAIRRGMVRLLAHHGFDAHSCAPDDDPLGHVVRLAPAIVILDVRMRPVSGMEIARRIRERFSGRSPLIALFTGAAGELGGAVGHGVDAVFEKTGFQRMRAWVAAHGIRSAVDAK